MGRFLDRVWYARHPLAVALAPLGWAYGSAAQARRWLYARGALKTVHLPVPVVVVGNLTVGGTGKTPLVIWLHDFLRRRGYKPGVVVGGYKGRARHWPQQVRPDSDPVVVGDEAVVLARHCAGPIAAGPDRVATARALLEHSDCDVLLSDDGLQHYGLGRDVEIAVLDGTRRLGNGRCLPAGPLREPPARLREVDLVVTNGVGARGEYAMRYVPQAMRSLHQPRLRLTLESMRRQRVHAVAGLGNPDRFFQMLRAHGLDIVEHPFPDHHLFSRRDLQFAERLPVVMTEKDAVKCERFATEGHWYLPVQAELPAGFEVRLLDFLRSDDDRQEVA